MQHCATPPPSPSSSSSRPSYYRYLFFALASLIGSASAQAPRIIGDSDPSVVYTPEGEGANLCAGTISDECRDKWFTELVPGAYKGAVKATQGPNARVQLKFRGSQIVVKGVKADRGAKAFVTLDNGTPISIDTEARETQADSILYSMTGLEPNVEHTLSIQYDAGRVGRRRPRLLRIDSFEITDGPSGQQPVGPSPQDDGGFPPLPTSTSTNTPTFTASVPNGPSLPSSSSSTATENGPANGGTSPPIIGTASNSSPSTVPIVAGLATGLATLIVASAVIFFLLRRRRAVRVQSVEVARSAGAGAGAAAAAPRRTRSAPRQQQTPRMSGMANLAYAFNRRGSSTASSSDHGRPARAPPPPPPTQPLPPVPVPPRINTYVNPYTYSRGGPAYPRSDDESSIGLPVDERPPNVPLAHRPTLSPVAQSPRVLRVYNPDGSTVVSSSNAH